MGHLPDLVTGRPWNQMMRRSKEDVRQTCFFKFNSQTQ